MNTISSAKAQNPSVCLRVCSLYRVREFIPLQCPTTKQIKLQRKNTIHMFPEDAGFQSDKIPVAAAVLTNTIKQLLLFRKGKDKCR